VSSDAAIVDADTVAEGFVLICVFDS